MQIDGVWRIAGRTDAPFYRLLQPEDKGPDVGMLNSMLDSLGQPSTAGENWTEATSKGVDGLAAALGVQNARHVAFDPGWVVWLPTEAVLVAEFRTVLGGAAPAAGSTLAAGPPVVTSAQIDLERSDLSTVVDSGWQLVTDIGKAPYSGDPSKPVADPALLWTQTAVGEASSSATLERDRVVPGYDLAPSAIVESASGQFCVFAVDSVENKRWHPVKVTVLGGKLGTSRVTPATKVSGRILLNPATSAPGSLC